MLSNTITIAIPQSHEHETRVIESLQAFSPTRRLSFPAAFSLESPALRARRATANEATIERIAEIIGSYRISGREDRYEDVFKPGMLETLRVFVAKQQPINMVVPAYPFKSPNRDSKVLGPAPDVGTRLSLQHLNSIGARIQQVYPPGGHVTIVSDGCCYNDLLGVSDEEVYQYAEGLHIIVSKLQLRHIKFSDLFELMGTSYSPASEAEYAAQVGALRDDLLALYLPPGYDFDKEIKHDNNALMTYRGYIKFLSSDLETYFAAQRLSKSAIRKHCSKTARAMIERGKAFSALVATRSPRHVRLSIHASDNRNKLSVALLPQKRYAEAPVTPWHNTPYLDADTEGIVLGHRPNNNNNDEKTATKYRLCEDEYGLKFLCANIPMYNDIIFSNSPRAKSSVRISPLYPSGLRILLPKSLPSAGLNLAAIAALARLHSPLVFKGLQPSEYTLGLAAGLMGCVEETQEGGRGAEQREREMGLGLGNRGFAVQMEVIGEAGENGMGGGGGGNGSGSGSGSGVVRFWHSARRDSTKGSHTQCACACH